VRGRYILCAVIIFSILCLSGLKKVFAFDHVSAQEVYDMVMNNEAILIDVRASEECAFVGSPALEAGGDPITYLIPWKLYDGIDAGGNKKFKDNLDFDALILQTFGDDTDQQLIVMCAAGSRSSSAASRLEELGFTYVQELDGAQNGTGGFQGPINANQYEGYKGYPGRLSDSLVSWMDTGLPVTYKIDPDKIPKIEQQAQQSRSGSGNLSNFVPYGGYPTFSYQQRVYTPQSYFAPSYQYQAPFVDPVFRMSNFWGGSSQNIPSQNLLLYQSSPFQSFDLINSQQFQLSSYSFPGLNTFSMSNINNVESEISPCNSS